VPIVADTWETHVQTSAWEHHIQPLLSDIGLVLNTIPVVASATSGIHSHNQQHDHHRRLLCQPQPQPQQQQVAAWFDLVNHVCTFCVERGLTSWAEVLLHLVDSVAGIQEQQRRPLQLQRHTTAIAHFTRTITASVASAR